MTQTQDQSRESEKDLATKQDGAEEAQASPNEALGKDELQDELSILKQELEAAKLEAKDNYDKYVRSVAQMENIRKRSEKERHDASQYALESFSKDLLPVLDSLGKALAVQVSEELKNSPMLDGIHLVQKQLIETLKKHGLEEVQSLGERFDPKVHQAISRQEKIDTQEETVAVEYSKGYVLNGRLLRPAMVMVEVPPNS